MIPWLSDFIQFLTGLSALVAVVVGAIKYFRSKEDGKVVTVIVTVAVCAAILAAGLVFNGVASGSSSQAVGSGTATRTSTQAGAAPSQLTPTATLVAIATATFTSTPPPLPSPPDVSTYGTTTFDPNWRLDCGGCDQPLLVTVTSVATNASAENMVWTFSVYNHSAETMQGGFDLENVVLTDTGGAEHEGSGPNGSVVHGAKLPAGQTGTVQLTFSFLPQHNTTYSVQCVLYRDYTAYANDATFYGPQPLSFP